MTRVQSNQRPAHVLLDRAAFRHNLQRARDLVPQSKVMAVIKADAYGHGMALAADSLDASDELAVNSLDDVKRLRQHGIDKTITLLSALLNESELEWAAKNNVRPIVFNHGQLRCFENLSLAEPLSVWLKVDTGMGRLGFALAEVDGIATKLLSCKAVKELSLMSHMANADQLEHELNGQQIENFQNCVSRQNYHQTSLLNSAGILNFTSVAGHIIRPGLLLYGISPISNKSAQELELKPVMTFKSELISVKPMAAGSFVGYGSEYKLPQDTHVGTVACGYGDGYPRHAPSGTPVFINGQRVPLIGRVSMDMLAVDLTTSDAKVGDSATLWGVDNPIESIAAAATTIAYELCCSITARVERVII